jgi:hypothetical protein
VEGAEISKTLSYASRLRNPGFLIKRFTRPQLLSTGTATKKWSQLPVKLLIEYNKYLYFTSETPEFSFFAITGKVVEKETGAETKSETDTQELEQNSTASGTGQEQKN